MFPRPKTRTIRSALLGAGALSMAACAVTPKLDTAGVDDALTPQSVVAAGDSVRGKRIHWGGVIIETRNLPQRTRIEVLAFALDRSGHPDRDAKALGRFLLVRKGYLEPADFAAGRLVTVVGPVIGFEQGRVDQSEYLYPVVEAQQLYLWPPGSQAGGARFHFGIGVIAH